MSDEKMSLLEWMETDGGKPVALWAHAGIYPKRFLFTRDPKRIHDVCSKTLIPKQEYLCAVFPEEIMGMTIWTEESVINLCENHEGGTSVTQVPRNPPDEPERDLVTA